jgi:DNA-binding transcriptional LysR family regulator
MVTAVDLELFVAIADTGSLSAAAKKCAVTRATLTRRLELLEERLGTPLVNRTTRNVSLTEAGNVYLEGCRDTLSRLRQAEAAVLELSGQPRGPLRIACPIISVDHVVGPLLTSFVRDYPDVDLQMHLSSEPFNPLVDGCDVALQIGPPSSAALIARCLLRVPYELVASPAYLERRGTPASVEALREHDCIVSVRGHGVAEPWPLKAGGALTVERPKILANATPLVRLAALKGLGIALIARALVLDDIASGALVRVLEQEIGEEVPVNLVYTASARLSPKVRCFVEFASLWSGQFANRVPESDHQLHENAPSRSAAGR